MAATPDGNGYWLVASDGGVFSFGDAAFHGSTGTSSSTSNRRNDVTPSGNGYTMVASDGGIFTFGDAHSKAPSVAHLSHDPSLRWQQPERRGYWFSDTNGAVTSEGPKANYWGSAPQVINKPVVAWRPTGGGWLFRFAVQSGAYGYDVSNCSVADAPGPFHRRRRGSWTVVRRSELLSSQ